MKAKGVTKSTTKKHLTQQMYQVVGDQKIISEYLYHITPKYPNTPKWPFVWVFWGTFF